MWLIRSREFVVWTVVSVALAGCAAVGHFDPVPSRPIDLSGNWMLDRTASDDPKPLLEKLRPQGGNHAGVPQDLGPDDNGPAGAQGPGGSGRRGRGGRGGGQPAQAQPSYRSSNEAFVKVPVMKMLTADIARAEQVSIRQSPDQFSLDYGTSVRTFTPGLRSVVSADWGVADQSSGWKGKEFVIEVKPQQGVASLERFSLSDDGKLIEQLKLGGGDYPVVELKRVYDHSDKLLPRAFPSND